MGVLPTTYGAGLAERVAALAPNGVDAALHSAPSNSLADLVAIVGDAARVVTVVDHQGAAQLGAARANARNDSALLRQASAHGQAGSWTPRVDHEFALADIADAHTTAESGSGKVVVTLS
jgi:NADPH:quinone reductase-like Zn-dependent oxidoreductase